MDAARALVRDQHLGANLQNMVLAVAPRAQTFNMAGAQVGPAKALELLHKHMGAVLPKLYKTIDCKVAGTAPRGSSLGSGEK